MRALRLIVPLALIAALGGFGLQSARADGPHGYGHGGYGPPRHPQGFHGGYRPDFPHHGGGHHHGDYYRHHHYPRYPHWYGYDPYRHHGHHGHHHGHFGPYPQGPYGVQY